MCVWGGREEGIVARQAKKNAMLFRNPQHGSKKFFLEPISSRLNKITHKPQAPRLSPDMEMLSSVLAGRQPAQALAVKAGRAGLLPAGLHAVGFTWVVAHAFPPAPAAGTTKKG